jgi:hypothetical protein
MSYFVELQLRWGISGMGSVGSIKSIAGTMYGQYLLLISTKSGRRTWSRGIGLDTPILEEMRHRPAHFERNFMNRIVKRELKHIPRGEKGSLQNFLRFSFNALRRKHLTLRKTRDETLKELIEKIKKANPDFIPKYDKDYFKI